MGSPTVFTGSRTKFISSKGALLKDGSVIDNDGVPNFIKNGHAEINTTGWATYADAAQSTPVDGTGGTANITWTRVTTTPLAGAGSFAFTKDTSNRLGQGVSYEFTVDPAYRARVCNIQFDYIFTASNGTFDTSNSNLTVYIYDVTNSQLIQPSTYTFSSNSQSIPTQFQSSFQTSATGATYRLIFHVATAATVGYTIKFDNVQVTPTEYAYGTPITDLTSYTPTITTTSGTMTNYTAAGFWKRDGGDLIMSATITFTGSVGTWAGPTFSLPPGLQIDFNKGSFFDGTGYLYRNGTGVINVSTVTHGTVVAASTIGTDKVRIGVSFIDTVSTSTTDALKIGATSLITQSFPESFVSGSTISIQEFRVPILGWSSSVQTSDQTSTRVVAARAYRNSALTVTTSPAKIGFDVVSFDDLNGFSNGTYTVKVPGKYRIKLVTCVDGVSTDLFHQGYIYVDGVSQSTMFITYSNGNSYASGITELVWDCKSGTTIEGWIRNNTNNRSLVNGSTTTYIDIERISGPNQIAATELIAARYTKADATAFNGGGIRIFGTKLQDTHGAYNTGTGYFTAPISGFYHIEASVQAASVTYAAGQNARLYFGANGIVIWGAENISAANETVSKMLTASTTVYLLAGQTLGVITDSSPTVNFAADSTRNSISIFRVGM